MTRPDPSRIRSYTQTLMAQGHRQVLVVEGASLRHTAERAGQWLGISLTVRFQKHRGAVHVVYVSDRPSTPFQKCRVSLLRQIPPPFRKRVFVHPVVWSRVWTRMGTTNQAVVVDLTSLEGGWRPNRLAMIADTVEGGGWLVLLVPPLDTRTLPPFERRFFQRTRSMAAWVHLEKGLLSLPILPTTPEIPPPHPSGHAVEELSRTRDQQQAFRSLVRWWDSETSPGLLLHAHRGRGKSFLLGMFLGWLARQSHTLTVSVMVPSRLAARSLFQGFFRACRLLGLPTHRPHARMHAGTLRLYVGTPDAPPPFQVDLLVVDEAAQHPYAPLVARVRQANRALLATTLLGYEGTGRSFALRLQKDLNLESIHLDTPIRFVPGDPLEKWLQDVLLLNPSAPPLSSFSNPILHERDPITWLQDEASLRAWVGLYRDAHYRYEPNDVQRMLNAPHIRLWELREGNALIGILEEARESFPDGLIPDVIRRYLDPSFSLPGVRVVRIALHPDHQRKGWGRRLLQRWRQQKEAEGMAWVGTAFGLTPELIAFWVQSGYRLIWIGPGPHPASGRFTGVWMDPLRGPDKEILQQWGQWTRHQLLDLLDSTYREMDVSLVHALLEVLPIPEGTPPLVLTEDQQRRMDAFQEREIPWAMVRDVTRILARCVLLKGWDQEESEGAQVRRVLVDHWIRGVPLESWLSRDVAQQWKYRSHLLWNQWMKRWKESAERPVN